MRREASLATLSAGAWAVVMAAGLIASDRPLGAAEAPVQVMVLGSVHLANPGRDYHNTTVGDVLEPAFQAEIVRVTEALARFKPTAVHVEAFPDETRERYALYRADKLEPSRDETTQLGFRLARMVGLETVHGVDVTAPFPFPRVQDFAKAHGQAALLAAMDRRFEAMAREEEDILKTRGLAVLLRRLNEPARIDEDHSFYRSLLRIGAGQDQPGGELLAEWYRRNFLICANTLQLSRPGDRIVMIFGAGHSFLLRQCVSETPGLELIEPNVYLPQ